MDFNIEEKIIELNINREEKILEIEVKDNSQKLELNLVNYDDTEIKKKIKENTEAIEELSENKANRDEIKTKTSELINDSDFVSDPNYTHTDNNFTNEEKEKLSELENYDDTEIKQDISDLETNKADKNEIPDVTGFITKDVNDLTYYTLKTNTGSLIDLEINQTTYVVTLSLKDQDGNVISTDTIDLPLENVVVSGSYDSVNEKIVLTLQSGDTVDIPVGALVAGLQSEITSSNKLASDLVDDSNSGHKFVTTSEKQAWNGKYEKPSGGIPKTDLSSDVQTSLGKADTALQMQNIRDGQGDLSIEENQDSIAIGKWSHSEGRSQHFEVTLINKDLANNKIIVNDEYGLIRKNALLWIIDANGQGAYYYVIGVSGTSPSITLTLDSVTRELKNDDGSAIYNHNIADAEIDSTIKVYMGVAAASASHVEGNFNNTVWLNSANEKNEVNVNRSHAEGSRTLATGYAGHVEGEYTKALNKCAHAEGRESIADGENAHAEGLATWAHGNNTHTAGRSTEAKYDNQTVVGKYNNNQSTSLFEVGNGADENNKRNAFTVNNDGSITINNDYLVEIGEIDGNHTINSRINFSSWKVGSNYDLGNGDKAYGKIIALPYKASNGKPYGSQIFFPTGDMSNQDCFWFRNCNGLSGGNPSWNNWIKVSPNSYIKTSSIKTNYTTNSGYVYDVTYINTMLGNIESLLSEV